MQYLQHGAAKKKPFPVIIICEMRFRGFLLWQDLSIVKCSVRLTNEKLFILLLQEIMYSLLISVNVLIAFKDFCFQINTVFSDSYNAERMFKGTQIYDAVRDLNHTYRVYHFVIYIIVMLIFFSYLFNNISNQKQNKTQRILLVQLTMPNSTQNFMTLPAQRK